MAKAEKSSGSFSKVQKLITVLEKCNGKTTIGDSDALISPKAVKILMYSGLLLLAGALFVVCFLTYPLIASFLSVEAMIQSLMLIIMLVVFVLAVKNIVTVLYTADDLSVLLPMPFSAGQIVTAKLAVSSRFPVILSLIVINSICLGFGIRMGVGAAFIIGTVLSSLLIPVTGIAIVTLLVVIVFRVFGFIRNRDITMALGGVFMLLMIIAYIILTNSLNTGESAEAASAVVSTMSSLSAGFPNISFMHRFMFEGNIVGLLISVGMTAAFVAIAMLAVKRFYLTTALSMQNTADNKKAVAKDTLSSREKISAVKALTSYESKSARRNPAYMIYGFGMSFLWPLFVILPLVLGNNNIFAGIVHELDFRVSLVGALLFGVVASGFSCGLNILAVSAFSREGDNFAALKATPISFEDYYKSKRNFALLICSLGSIVYILILGIVCAIFGIVPVQYSWVFLISALICWLLNMIFVNIMLVSNSRKPYFTWDSETEISRKLTWVNVIALVIGIVAEIALMIGLVLSAALNAGEDSPFSNTVTLITVITTAVLCIGVPVLAFAVNRVSVKKAEKNLIGSA